MPVYLSKSDFKLARTCSTKLYYRMLGYPSTSDDNEYLQLLADGGYMIEQLARLLFPGGREIGFLKDLALAAEETMAALAADKVVLFEATLISNGKIARADILIKDGQTLTLIEVKAKSYDSREHARALAAGKANIFRSTSGITRDWRPYLEDVTFQVAVLQELFPDLQLSAYLMMPDKSKSTAEVLYSTFRISAVQDPETGWTRMLADYSGDLTRIHEEHFLIQVNVDAEVRELLPEVQRWAQIYVDSLYPQPRKLHAERTHYCKDCEFHSTPTDGRDGFRECWGGLADINPHLFDLYQVGKLCQTATSPGNILIQQGMVSMFDLIPELLVTKDGRVGVHNRRQRIQLEYTRRNQEWISPELLELIGSYTYPLHFIDFETSALAIPYHAGMRPYEDIAFQWSCHTLRGPESEPEHAEWINEADEFPNFAFAESLMAQIGSTGTIFSWSPHEKTILNRINTQLGERQHRNPALAAWLQQTAERIVDLNALTIKHYFHPLMKSSTSLKKVIDAIWQTDPAIRRSWISYVKEADGLILSPYQALPQLEISGKPVVVKEGTEAVRAYQAMMYRRETTDDGRREQWKRLLLEYCKLDTLAMVMVWHHWCQLGE